MLLRLGQRRMRLSHVPVGGEKEPAGTARRVTDDLPRLRIHAPHDGRYNGPRREILSCPALGIASVLLEQPLVGIALEIIREARPLCLADEVDYEQSELSRIPDLVPRI